MSESKHGGSPESGLVQPAGLESMTETSPGGIIIPEIHKQANERQKRALHFARREIAKAVLPELIRKFAPDSSVESCVDSALKCADHLIAKTGGEV